LWAGRDTRVCQRCRARAAHLITPQSYATPSNRETGRSRARWNFASALWPLCRVYEIRDPRCQPRWHQRTPTTLSQIGSRRPSRGPVERVALVVRVHLGEVLTVSGTQDVPAPLLAKGRAVEPRLSRDTRRASSTCPRTTSLRRPPALFGPSSIMRGPSVRRAAASTVRARVHGARASSHNPAGPTRAPEPRRAAGSRKHPSAPAPERSGRGELSLHARPRITREPQGSSKRAARHRSIRAAARASSAAITLRAPRTAC
jgi:hypothetical protein